jgi:hypothetical protein
MNPPRNSTSDIPSINFQNADYTINIPKPLYKNLEQQSPPTKHNSKAKMNFSKP